MRSVSVAIAALFGAAAANPVEWPRNYQYEPQYNPYPTGVSSSSSSSQYSASSTSSSQYSASTSSSSYYSASSSSSSYSASIPSGTGYSSYVPSSSSSYSASIPSGTGYSSYVPTSSKYSSEYHPSGTGYSSYVPSSSEYPHSSGTGYSSKPYTSSYPTGGPSTEVITTYTTTTVCPVTYTSGTQVITSTTTSVVTITSCKAGCHQQTTYSPAPPKPTGSPITVPTTVTSTTYTFVPCSTSVGHNGGSVIYSTYLTASYYPTTYVSSTVIYPTSKPTIIAPQPPVVVPENCPAPSTVTVYAPQVTVYAPHCESCETKTYVVTEHGSKTTITVTVPATDKPTYSPGPIYSESTGPKPSHSTYPTGGSSSSGIPHPTGYIPYPTESSSSVIYDSSSRVGPKPTGYGYYGSW